MSIVGTRNEYFWNESKGRIFKRKVSSLSFTVIPFSQGKPESMSARHQEPVPSWHSAGFLYSVSACRNGLNSIESLAGITPAYTEIFINIVDFRD